MRAAGVVAAHPRLRRAPEIERIGELVGMRAGPWIDDGMGVVGELEPVAPVGMLGALVRAIADLDGLSGERRARIGRLEVELDHLPVALVQVVEIVVGVEEPVLERELPRMCGVGCDVCVRDGIAAFRESMRPAFVVAPRVERRAGEVQVVLEAVGEIACCRADLYEVHEIPWPAQRNGGLVEEQIDVDRPVLLAVPAFLRLRNDTDDRCVAFGERGLVGQVGACDWRKAERRHGEQPEQCQADQAGTRPAHTYGFDAKRCIPRFWERKL